MHMLEILIEDHGSGAVRSLRVLGDVPVASLLPELAKELALPQTDLFGKELKYRLYRPADGQFIPGESTLLAAGVQSGARLNLLPLAADEVTHADVPVVSSALRLGGDFELHSSPTIADNAGWFNVSGSIAPPPPPDVHQSVVPPPPPGVSGPVAPAPIQRTQRRWTRRAVVVAAFAAVGLGATGLGYAAYNAARSAQESSRASSPAQPPLTTSSQAQTQPGFTAPRLVSTFQRHTQMVRTVAWSPDGTLLASGGDDARLMLWEMNGTVRHTLHTPAAVHALAWAPDGQRLLAAAANQVLFFNALTGKTLALHRQTQTVTSVGWSAQQSMQAASAGTDQRTIIWDGTTYRPVATYAQYSAPIEALSWAPDGKTVATASSGGLIRMWETGYGTGGYGTGGHGNNGHGKNQDQNQGQRGYSLGQGEQVALRALAFAPTGMQLAAGGDDGDVRLWTGLNCSGEDEQCQDAPQHLHAATTAILALAWSPDGQMLAAGAEDGTFSIWSPTQPQKALFTQQQGAAVRSLFWSPDGKYIAMAVGKTVTLWQF